jgi:glycosyltransferase involved in cell wall biosynthesis
VRVIYVLLSPTFGMHQYTADLANRIADILPGGYCQSTLADWEIRNPRSPTRNTEVVLVTTSTHPPGRYGSKVRIETPITSHGTGFSRQGADAAGHRRVLGAIEQAMQDGEPGRGSRRRGSGTTPKIDHRPPVVHFTGVHAWNVGLVRSLRRRGARVIHTLHDLHPHDGVRYGRLIGLWNRLIIGSGAHILVHGRRYRDELLALSLPPERVTCTPLLHGFWGFAHGGGADPRFPASPALDAALRNTSRARCAQNPSGAMFTIPSGHGVVNRLVLFFGRVEAYKGVDVLLVAWKALLPDPLGARLVVAGQAGRGVSLPPIPPGAEWRNRLIDDEEALGLFAAASLLVLPYRDATQSALIAAAYAFGVPVIVTDAGALPEYVVDGETGWIVPAGNPRSLAAALREALADPKRLARMGRAGRDWYETQRKLEEAALAAMYAEVPRSTP